VFLGSLDWWPNRQGLVWLIDEVMPLVVAKVPEAELCVIGGGDPGPLVERLESPFVHRIGFVSDLRSSLRQMDIGVVPVDEGTGVKTKTLDLMAAGLPVVATPGGVRGTPGAEGGVIVNDSPAAFAEAVISLLCDADRRRTLASKGLAVLAQRHGAEATAEWAADLRCRISCGAET
jgi:glycosyltransferase involved in cell wall biosynthesis